MNKPTKPYYFHAGFTLLELSIVLIIISLLVGFSLTLGAAQIGAAKRSQTYEKMNAIEQALLAYRRSYNRLPCPASLTVAEGTSSFGTEAGAAGDCTASGVNSLPGGSNRGREGAVPVVALNLPPDFMFDGWGERFDYAVDKNITLADAFTTYPIGSAIGDLQVNDSNGTAITSVAVYVLTSFGENAIGGYNTIGTTSVTAFPDSTDEKNNCNCAYFSPTVNNVWVAKPLTGDMSDSANYFDDIVHFKTRWQLRNYDE